MATNLKKLISVVLVVLMCMTAAPLGGFVGIELGFGANALPSTGWSPNGSLGENISYTLDEETGVLKITGTGEMNNFNMASTSWYSPFLQNEKIKIVEIGEGITSLGDMLFYECSGIVSVSLPNTLKTIGNKAFAGCKGLVKITIPDSVTTIDIEAFCDCSSLSEIQFGNSLEEIAVLAFCRCTALTSLTLPNSIKTIGTSAFSDAPLTSIKYIGTQEQWEKVTVVTGNEEITDLTITFINTANKIGDNVYYDFDSETGVLNIVGTGATYDYDHTNAAFLSKNKITSVTVNKGVTALGKYLFADCYSITKVNLPSSLESIDECAFINCVKLWAIAIPSKVKTIGSYAFMDCGLQTVTFSEGLESIGSGAFAETLIENVSVPDSVTSVGSYAFSDCDKLKSVSIGKGVKRDNFIGMFNGCDAIETITVDADNEQLKSVDNVVYDKDITAVCFYAPEKTQVTFIVPDTVTSISHASFLCHSNLKKLVIPVALAEVDEYAFGKLAPLTDIYYMGTQEQWNAIWISNDGNDMFDNATKHFSHVHSEQSFVVDEAATCTTAGSKTCICECGYTYSAAIAAAHSDGKDDLNNICDNCGEYIGSYSLTVGTNENVPFSSAFDTVFECVKFVPSESCEYVVSLSGIFDSVIVEVFDFADNGYHKLTGAVLEQGETMEYDFAAGETYYMFFHFALASTETCTVVIQNGCLHTKGTVQDCLGWVCTTCQKHFGEVNPEKHVWKANGQCELCSEWHDHTGLIVNGECSVCHYQLPVELISGTESSYYNKFASALTAAKDGDTIKFRSCVVDMTRMHTVNKAITIDLNGNVWDQPSSYSIEVNANVTFTDSVGGGKCSFSVCVNSLCTFEGGLYRSVKITDNLADTVLSDLVPQCVKGYKYSGTYDNEAKEYKYTLDGNVDLNNVTFYDNIAFVVEHTFGDTVATKAATCLAKGNDAYKQCTVCQNYFASDAKASALGSDSVALFEKAQLEHSYTGEYKSNSDGKDGTHSKKCVNGCGEYGIETVHVWDNGTMTDPATHTTTGVMTYSCECGATYTEEIAKLEEHTYVDTLVAPTCTSQGYTTHECACGSKYTDSYVTELGHEFKEGKCTRCEAVDENYVDPDPDDNTEPTPDPDNNPTEDDNFDCDCICHNLNKFVRFFYKIARFFWMIFKINQTCSCGAVHY